MSETVTITIEDVGGSFKRAMREAPRMCAKFMGTAVFLTSRRTLDEMERLAPLGPDGQGATPDEHIKFDLDENWSSSRPLSARVGIFDNEGQAQVALYNEYKPNRQPFMKSALLAQESSFHKRAIEALQALEAKLSVGVQ